MEFDLREYQARAALDVLDNLARALDSYRDGGRRSSFSLSALTGAGKTVIAAAVVEAMLNGSPELETEPRPDTVFLWLTDDPALNRQTRDRMLQASDRLAVGQLPIIDDRFDQSELDPGKVYFLNTQKFASSTSYVKSGVDGREYSLWDTIANTARSATTDLVFILDEAHRGMTPLKNKKSTVRELIDGRGGHAAAGAPVVWGISATVDRFEEAMKGTAGRDHLRSVEVSTDLIRASGLVKDQIVLDNPEESGAFNTTLLRDAVRTLSELDQRWNKYTEANGLNPVRPVMVAQVPDNASDAKIGELVQVISEEWPDSLPDNSFVHVLGDHTNRKGAGRNLRYLSPERIEDDMNARFVIAKEAITTGWDCPRAEVLYSERPGRDETHIAQLIGRIVRTPLAKRVSGDERLSTVSCFLPYFDREAVDKVVSRLQSGDDAAPVPVVRQTGDFHRVSALAEAGVYEVVAATPCEPAPQPLQNPIKRARILGALLAEDGLVPGAPAQLRARLNGKLDGLGAEHAEKLEKNIHDVEHVDLERTIYGYAAGTEAQREKRQVRTDLKNVTDAYQTMIRKLKDGVAQDYNKYLDDQVEAEGDEADYFEIKARIAGLLMIEGVVDAVEETADAWARAQLEAHRVAIRGLNAERQAEYGDVQAMAASPERVDLQLPEVNTVTTEDGKGNVIPKWKGHVFHDEGGLYAAKLNDWEKTVVEKESSRKDFVAWYRNPSTPTKAAVRIAYRDGGEWRSLQPDFIVVSRNADGDLVRSVIDPHGDYLADSLPKLQALARYAAKYAGELHRVEPTAKVGEELRVLDLTEDDTRAAVLAWDKPGVGPLFSSANSRVYS